MQIRVTRDPRHLQALFALRHRVYVEELERTMRYADPLRRRVVEPLDQGSTHLVALDGGRVVGGVRLSFARDGALDEYEELYELDRLGAGWRECTSVTSRLVATREMRGSTLALRLCRTACRHYIERGIRFDVIDCHAALRRLYEALGYRDHRDAIVHPDNGPASCMVFDAHDDEHLAHVRSPLRSIARSARHVA